MARSRRAALTGAVLIALGFVVIRVVYRVLFGGADGAGLLLVDLPRIRLAGPFEHITLLGPVTSGGIAAAASSALPFAALVLAIGLLSVLIDVRALLARGAVRGPVRTVSRALVIAWATFPALLDAVHAVRVARELRGERGAASLIVPVLERTVERAIDLGASMEVRGFASTRRAEPACERPVSLSDVSLGYGAGWLLERVDLQLLPGTVTLVSGATGSGKSTLLQAMSGLFQHVAGGLQRGTIEIGGVDRIAIPPRETSGFVGVVPQAVRLSFVAATVFDEIGFALANRGVAPAIVAHRVQEIAQRLAITHLLDRLTGTLSAGEACLVAIGAAIVEQPILVLADEPLAELDAAARRRVVDVLGRLAHEAGVCVVVAEHSAREWGDTPDERLEILEGGLRPVSPAPMGRGHAVPVPVPVSGARAGIPIAEIRNLSVTHGDLVAVDDVSLSFVGGEVVALRGPNGAGKSSLLHAMAQPVRAGTVLVAGADVQALSRRSRRQAIALVPEQFDDLLFATTVAEECRMADRRAGRAGAATRFSALLGDSASAELLSRHPRDLSAGQRLCLVLAIQLSTQPTVLLVDEPSRGLDDAARALVGGALLDVASSGAAVVIATHDERFAASVAARTVDLAGGRVVATIGASR